MLKYVEVESSGASYTDAVDLWAVGCILYRLLTGTVPFPPGRSLIRYCDDESLFPATALHQCGTSKSGEVFIRALLAVSWSERPSAPEALEHEWIVFGGLETTGMFSLVLVDMLSCW
jgi:serine/threonine protein kinase